MYYIVELQKFHDGTAANLVTTAEALNEAMSKYYGILQYAAISEVAVHAAVVMDEDGRYVAQNSFRHDKIEESTEE